MRTPQSWRVHNKNRFLLAVMEELAGDDAEISFEGDFAGLGLFDLPGALTEESVALRRNTLWPKQDFVIVPLRPSLIQGIFSALGGTISRSVIHIQIAKGGKLEFGAYDNFHPHALNLGNALTEDFVAALVSDEVLESLKS